MMHEKGLAKVKKGRVFVPSHVGACLDKLSKAALMDIAWNLCLLGTNETEEEMLIKIAREAELVCNARGDRLPKWLAEVAKLNPAISEDAIAKAEGR